MPKRTTANKQQRELFADISRLEKLALTTKIAESVSINIHGAFTLFDKHWTMVNEHNVETMLALKEDGFSDTSGEPAVHFHIDWRDIKWACIQPRHLELINTAYEIVFCKESNVFSRKFWFYLKEGIDTQLLISKWGFDWINLEDNYSSFHKNTGYEISQFKNNLFQLTIN